MKNETRLKILKISCICGGVLSLILVGLYVFLLVAFPGTVKFMPIQIALLPAGIVSVVVFSYMHLITRGRTRKNSHAQSFPESS